MACLVCQHPQLSAIDAQLQNGGAVIRLAALFDFDEEALAEHKREHLQAVAIVKVPTAPTLIDDLQTVINDVELRMTRKDITNRDYAQLNDVRIRALREIRFITGAHVERDPEDWIPLWHAFRDAILVALRPYPQAREAVEAAIERVRLEAKQ